jgi:uncharacterized protein YcbX
VRVAGLWRYPVKSMLGEELDVAAFDTGGIPSDRAWAVWLPGRRRPLSAKREPLLFEGRSRVDGDDVVVTLPTGLEAVAGDPDIDRALTDWLGYPATLAAAPDGHVFDDSPVHLLTTSSLASMAAIYPAGTWDVCRFRPSIVVDEAEAGFPEDEWLDAGVRLTAGEATFEVTHGCTRCTMVGLAQGQLPDDLGILEQVMAHNHERLGVYASVNVPGPVRVGDTLSTVLL